MGLKVTVAVTVNAPDDSPQLQVMFSDLTVNPLQGDFKHEAEVARVAANLMLDQLRDQLNTRLDDWANAMQAIQREQKQ